MVTNIFLRVFIAIVFLALVAAAIIFEGAPSEDDYTRGEWSRHS